jgi:Tetracyclin repressor-like, C-terminal domain
MNQKRWIPLVRKHYDPCVAVFLEHYRRALPEVNFDSLLNAFSFVSSIMLYVCSFTDRFGEWKERLRSVQSKNQNLRVGGYGRPED